jgi:hypothetical protein
MRKETIKRKNEMLYTEKNIGNTLTLKNVKDTISKSDMRSI